MVLIANGGFYTLRVGLQWPGFPEDAAIGWAPVGYPIRDESFVPSAPPTAPTNDALFDAVYLIAGNSASRVARSLTPAARHALLGSQDLRPSITAHALEYHSSLAVTRWAHIESSPNLTAVPDKFFVRIGTDLFTATQAVNNVRRLIALALALEDTQPDP